MSRGNQRSHQEKVAAVSRVLAGEAKASVSRSTGVPESTLRGWVKDERIMADAVKRLAEPAAANRRFTRTPMKIVACENGKKLYRVIRIAKEETIYPSTGKPARQHLENCSSLLQSQTPHQLVLQWFCSTSPHHWMNDKKIDTTNGAMES